MMEIVEYVSEAFPSRAAVFPQCQKVPNQSSLTTRQASNQLLISQRIFKSIVKSTHDWIVKSSALDLRLILL